MEQPGIDIELGDHEYRIIPQRQARLYRRLIGPKGVIAGMSNIGELLGEDSDMSAFLGVASDKLYEVLLIFIPDLMPEWEFEGYASESAAEREEYDETGDHSPTHPQVLNALQTAIQVNGVGWVKKILGFFDPVMVRAALTQWIAGQLQEQQRTRSGIGSPSPSSPSTNGESASTSSGTSDPTPSTPSEPEETRVMDSLSRD